MRAAEGDATSLPDDLAGLRALLAAAIMERDALKVERDVVAAERDALAERNERLQHLLEKLRRMQFGKKSERRPED